MGLENGAMEESHINPIVSGTHIVCNFCGSSLGSLMNQGQGGGDAIGGRQMAIECDLSHPPSYSVSWQPQARC